MIMKRIIMGIVMSILSEHMSADTSQPIFKLGIENITDEVLHQVRGRRVGLITNQTGRDQQGRRTVDVLRNKGVHIQTLFVPEHGMHGEVAAEHDVHDIVDTKTGIPIISLYGKGTGKPLSADTLKNIDVLMFDIQDSGMRHYTYIATLYHAIEAAAQHARPLIVLDRPNPLGGVMEGPLVDPALRSFISIAPIPLRHGMTVGELARYFTTLIKTPARLHVVPMIGYRRTHGLARTCVPTLSPNIQSHASCYGYSFLGLLGEVRPLDVGVGTPHAFQCITLAHDIQVPPTMWQTVREKLAHCGVHSAPHSYFNTRKKKKYVGLKINITDVHELSSFAAFITIVRMLKQAGVALTFSKEFDKAVGSSHVRDFLMGQTPNLAQLLATDLHRFCAQARSFYLYEPLPQVRSTLGALL